MRSEESAQRYWLKGKDARRDAKSIRDPVLRLQLIEVAEGFEALARSVELLQLQRNGAPDG
jgi:hypothetical protein